MYLVDAVYSLQCVKATITQAVVNEANYYLLFTIFNLCITKLYVYGQTNA